MATFRTLLVLALLGPAASAAEPARMIPAQEVEAYYEFQGLAAHEKAWRLTEAHAILNQTPTGAMVVDLITQVADWQFRKHADVQLSADDLKAIGRQLAQGGFIAALYEHEAQRASVTLIVPGAGGKDQRERFERLLKALTATFRPQKLKLREREMSQVTGVRLEDPETPADSALLWWFEENDLIILFNPPHAQAIAVLDAIEGKIPNATTHAGRRAAIEEGKTIAGFEPDVLFFLEPAPRGAIASTLRQALDAALAHPRLVFARFDDSLDDRLKDLELRWMEARPIADDLPYILSMPPLVLAPAAASEAPLALGLSQQALAESFTILVPVRSLGQPLVVVPTHPPALPSLAEMTNDAPLPALSEANPAGPPAPPPPPVAVAPPAADPFDVLKPPSTPPQIDGVPVGVFPRSRAPRVASGSEPAPATHEDEDVKRTSIASPGAGYAQFFKEEEARMRAEARLPDPAEDPNAPGKILGLDGLARVVGCYGFQGKALVSVVRLEMPAPRKGLFAAFEPHPFDKEKLPPLPANASSFAVVGIDPVKSYANASGLLAKLFPALGKMEGEVEATLKKAISLPSAQVLFEHLSGPWMLVTLPKAGREDSSGQALVAEIRDPEAFAKALDQVAASLNKAFLDREAQLEGAPGKGENALPLLALERLPAPERGYQLTSPSGLVATLGEPTLLVGKHQVAIAASAKIARTTLACETNPALRLKPAGQASETLAKAPQDLIMLFYQDTKDIWWADAFANLPRMFQWACAEFTQMNDDRWKTHPDLLGLLGIPAPGSLRVHLAPGKSPTADQIRAHLFPTLTAVSLDDRGYRLVTREALPTLIPANCDVSLESSFKLGDKGLQHDLFLKMATKWLH